MQLSTNTQGSNPWATSINALQSQSVQNIWKADDQTTESWLGYTMWKQFYSIVGKYKHWYCTHNFLKPVVQMAMYEPLTFDLLLPQNGVVLEKQTQL